MRVLVIAIMLFGFGFTNAWAELFHYPSKNSELISENILGTKRDNLQKIRIFSTADNAVFADVILDFQSINPDVEIDYEEMQSIEIYERILSDSKSNIPSADLAISSAMDLQMKLANDGYAASVSIDASDIMPDWSKWRNEAFGITFEPSVIIYNKSLFGALSPPRNRSDLINFLNEPPSFIKGKVASYDIEKSGLGFLFLARDVEQYSATWDLIRALGKNEVRLFSGSSKMIDRVASGELALAYNILGSYAAAAKETSPDLEIILPEDYTVVFSRIALIPKAAGSTDSGKVFLEYLMSLRGQKAMLETASFNALHPEVKGPFAVQGLSSTSNNNLRPIKVRPSLLVYLDQVKRRNIIKQWKRALELP